MLYLLVCKYDGAQMHEKWQNSDPKCLFVLARFFSPTTLKLHGPCRTSSEISQQHGVVAECSPALGRSVRWILVQYFDILSEHRVEGCFRLDRAQTRHERSFLNHQKERQQNLSRLGKFSLALLFKFFKFFGEKTILKLKLSMQHLQRVNELNIYV